MRLRKFGLLLVLLLAPMVFLGAVQSVAPPTLTVNYKADTFTISGNGWTPNSPVTIFYDVKDTAHRIAAATADYFGAFTVNVPRVLGTTEGAHSLIVVQGALQATVTYNASPVSPPDDRLLNPILSISSDIQAIKNKLDTIDGEIQAVEAKLDAGGSFYNFVNNWFDTINGKLNSANTELNNVENKVDSVKTQVDAVKAEQVIYNGSEYAGTRLSNGMFGIVTITTNKICKYTIYYYAYWEDKDDYEDLDVRIDGGWIRDIPMGHIEAGISTKSGDKALTLVADGIHLHGYNEDGRTDISWAVVVEGSPGTLVNVTWE
jgi:hypothetical protein